MTKHVCSYARWGKRAVAIALLLAVFGLAGCDDTGNPFVLSLQPWYTKPDLATDSQLQGAWMDQGEEVTFSFEPGTEGEYKLTVKEREGGHQTSGEFEAHLVRLGATWFLDFFPKSSSEGDEFYRVHFLRAHSIARIEITYDSLQIAFLNASWLAKKIDEKRVDVPHEKMDGSLLLTGTTEEVQQLAVYYGNDDEAFAEPLLLERQRPEEVEK